VALKRKQVRQGFAVHGVHRRDRVARVPAGNREGGGGRRVLRCNVQLSWGFTLRRVKRARGGTPSPRSRREVLYEADVLGFSLEAQRAAQRYPGC